MRSRPIVAALAAAAAAAALATTAGPATAADPPLTAVKAPKQVLVGSTTYPQHADVGFTVALPTDSDEVEDVRVYLERKTSTATYRIADTRRRGCLGTVRCERNGTSVKVTVSSYLSFADVDTARLHAGTYRPVISVLTSGRSAYLTLRPALDVAVKPTSALRMSMPGKVRKGATARVTGSLSEDTPCLSVAQPCFSSRGINGATVELWFDADGAAAAKRVATAKTADGSFSKTVTVTAPGKWYARYAGSSTHAAATSPKRAVTTS